MPATICRVSPPRSTCSFRSFFEPAIFSAAVTSAARSSTFANSAMSICVAGGRRRPARLRRGGGRRRRLGGVRSGRLLARTRRLLGVRVFSMRGNRGSMAPSGVPGSSRPHARSSGAGSRVARPSMRRCAPRRAGITGDASTATRRMASSRRYRNASSSAVARRVLGQLPGRDRHDRLVELRRSSSRSRRARPRSRAPRTSKTVERGRRSRVPESDRLAEAAPAVGASRRRRPRAAPCRRSTAPPS